MHAHGGDAKIVINIIKKWLFLLVRSQYNSLEKRIVEYDLSHYSLSTKIIKVSAKCMGWNLVNATGYGMQVSDELIIFSIRDI